MKKLLLYDEKIFLNARNFYEFILTQDRSAIPEYWNLEYVAVSWSNRLQTISGIKVDWVSVAGEDVELLKTIESGWMPWTKGLDKSFSEFVASEVEVYTKEILWRLVVDYVVIYDIPRTKMKRMVDDLIADSEPIGKARGVLVYKQKE